MKKKLLLAISLVAVLICLFAITVSAETPEKYIEFGARFQGSDEYITVYTENAESTGNPRIDFASKKFYSDVEFTTVVDMSTATGIDFSVTKTYVNGEQGNAVTRMVKPSSPFVNCTEVKWFLSGMPTVSYNGSFFKGWTGLKSFDFGTAVTAIADNTFEGCGLESITIPASVTSIGGSAFKDCLSLKSVKIEGSVTKFNNATTFYGCTALETVDMGTSTYIGSSMFYGCTSLKSVTLGQNITTIDTSAFQNCTSLLSIELPTGITSIGNNAFKDCDALKSIYAKGTTPVEYAIILPEGITTIGSYTFFGVDTIKYIKLASTIETLGAESFRNNDNLQYIDYNNCKITGTIGKFEFYDNKSLIAVSLPSGITSLDSDRPFVNCNNLEVLYLNPNITAIAGFNSCKNLYFTNEPFTLNWTDGMFDTADWNGQKPEKPDIYYFPSGLTNFDEAFNSCQNLSDTVVFPAGVTSISHQYTFYNISGKNFVFLGEVTSFVQNSNAKSNFYFINDKVTEETLTVTGNGNYNFYFHSEGVHLCEKTRTVAPQCEKNGATESLCFCSYVMETVENENTALGHDSKGAEMKYHFPEVNGAQNYYKNRLHSYVCQREGCGETVSTSQENTALFTSKGYSKSGDAIVFGIIANTDNITEYNNLTGKNVKYGVVVAKDNGGDLIDVNGTVKDNSTLSAEFSGTTYVLLQTKITGISEAAQATTLHCCAFLADGTSVSYLYSNAETKEGAVGTTANSISHSTIPDKV